MSMKPRKTKAVLTPKKPEQTPAELRLQKLRESDEYGFFEDDDCTIW